MPDIKDEFEDIVAQLLEDRPQIDPTFARDLDTQAAAGFPRRRRFAFKLPRLMYVPAAGMAAAAAVIIAVGVAGGGNDSTDTSSGSGGASVAAAPSPEVLESEANAFEPQADTVQKAAGDEAPDSSRSSSAAADQALGTVAPSAPAPTGRQRVQELTAAVTLEAPARDIAGVGDQILQVTNQVGGFVVSSNVRATDGDSGGGNFVLRIPVDRLDEGLSRLSRLGHVRESSQGVQDITSERNVARENLQEGKAVRLSLLKRLAEADTDAEVESLRAQLRSVNAQIGSFRGQLRQVERRASFASVSLTLVASDKDSAAKPDNNDQWTPGDAFKDAGRVLEVVAGVAVVALAIMFPLALLVLAGLMTRRVLGRRGRERALDAI